MHPARRRPLTRTRLATIGFAIIGLALLAACEAPVEYDDAGTEASATEFSADLGADLDAATDLEETTDSGSQAATDADPASPDTGPASTETSGMGTSAPTDTPGPVRIRERTMPDWSLNTQFSWGPYGNPEVAQLVRIVEPFELTHVELGVTAPTLLQEGFFETDVDWNVRGEYVTNPDELLDVPATIRLSAFRGGPEVGGERIGLDQLTLIGQQTLPGPVHGNGQRERYELAEPVALTSGQWVLAFLLVAEDPAVLDLPLIGRESGDNLERNPETAGDCDYTRSEDPYPDGAVYYRGWQDHEAFPQPWSEPTVFDLPLDDAFYRHEAKVTECITIGLFGDDQPMNPGDIDLVLHGRDLP